MNQFTALHINNWNKIVASSWIYLYETSTHLIFRHPRKGFRRVSKQRLFMA